MSNQAKSVGTDQWKEVSKSWRIYAYVPIAHHTSVAEVLSSPGGLRIFSTSEDDSSRLTMFASESVLSREWNSTEEDEAWAHL